MIFYFSGTGNSKYIAQRIGKAAGNEVVSVSSNSKFSVPDNEEPVGFVFPVYYWGVPTAALNFLSALQIEGSHYTYLVLNCGGSTGDASGMVEKTLGRKMDAVFSLLMPDTYVPLYNVSNTEKNMAVLEKAEPEIDKIIQMVGQRTKGAFDKHRGAGKRYTATMYPLYLRKTTKSFKVEDDCGSCGLCAEVCADRFIEMVDGRPTWKEGHCNLCFACLHHCPKHAIVFGKRSKGHGQYVCPKTI